MEKNENVDRVKELIKTVFSVDIEKETRRRDFVDARRVYSKLMREKGYPYKFIGETIGKDHASIIHYLRDIDYIFVHDKNLFEMYKKCKSALMMEPDDDMLKPITDAMYKQRIKELEHEVFELNYKIVRLSKKVTAYNNIKNIIELIQERIVEGDEELVEKKIRAMFNGFKRE